MGSDLHCLMRRSGTHHPMERFLGVTAEDRRR
jgi:hypothetical protein